MEEQRVQQQKEEEQEQEQQQQQKNEESINEKWGTTKPNGRVTIKIIKLH